jgi:hypothetical protein
MTAPAIATTTWPLGLWISPAVDPASAKAEVADSVTGRRFRWSPDALAGYILRDDHDTWLRDIAASADRGPLAPGWRHWKEREWHPSDQYYVASRRWHYVDIDDIDGAVRSDAVRGFLEKDGPPAAEVLPDGPRVALGSPQPPPATESLARLLVSRRSGRAYVPRSVALDRLSGLLWHGLAHVRARRERIDDARPLSYLDSFGTAWDFYLCVYDVEGVEPGAYRYDLRAHELIGIRPGRHRAAMMDILQGMRSPMTAAWTLGLVADFPRYQWRYRHEHGLRRLYLESGIIGQELIILGGAYGLSSLVTPAQKDTPYLSLHGLPNDRYAPVYTLTMGLTRAGGGIDFADDPAGPRGE